MKKIILFLLLLNISASLQAQVILNNNFEIGSDTYKSAPKFWNFTIGNKNGEYTNHLSNGFVAYRDSTIAHSGKFSLRMSVLDSNNFAFACTQQCAVNISSPKKIHIFSWVKTIDCKKGAGLNCTQRNKNEERISYTSSRQQEELVMNTQEWTRIDLEVLLRPDTKSIEIWTYFYGAGTVWFDDISIDTVANKSVITAPIVSAYLDTVIKIVKQNSLYTDSIDWQILTKQLKGLASDMQTYKDARLLAGYIIDELHQHGDNHSFFLIPSGVKQFRAGDTQGRGRNVITKYLGEGIGYISMPGFASMSDSVRAAFSTNTQEQIKRIDTENKISSWVVDLRKDDGGSCPPMIAGLGPILGEGMYDFDISVKNDTVIYFYEKGESYDVENGKKDIRSTKVLHPYQLKNKNVPVAVLIGPHCGSSGECAVAAFIGRHDTKLFGQPTGGFTKGNEDFSLPDGSMIFISAGIQCDRNGKLYPERIFPDVPVEQPDNNSTDLTLKKAKKWLGSFKKIK